MKDPGANDQILIPRTALAAAPFSMGARTVMQLGRESISSSITAIIELVKNAYDADAGLVSLRFSSMGTGGARLLIEDDGDGMDHDALLENWLFIGTANKQRLRAANHKTSKNRILSGEKGLGRLGLDRLCRKTIIQTIQQGKSPVELTIDWSLYEDTTRRLEDIRHPVSKLPHLNFDPLDNRPTSLLTHGTRLLLEGLKDEWTLDDISELRDELALLLSPFQALPEFRISFDTGGADRALDGDLQPSPYVLDDALWKVVGRINSDNTVTINMTSPRDDYGYSQGPVAWHDFIKDFGTIPSCGPLDLVVYYYPRSEENSDGLVAAKARNAFVHANQGIRIYRDGVRVKPYGDPKGAGDWLQLSLRKTRSPAAVTRERDWRVAYYQVVGAVFITHDRNPGLSDQTNREGLLKNNALKSLNAFALKVIRYFEDKHSAHMASKKAPLPSVEALQRQAEEATLDAKGAFERLKSLVLAKERAAQPSVSEAFEEAQRRLDEGIQASQKSVEAVQRENQEVIAEKNMLSNLASLGIIAATFGHETVNDADSLVKFTMRLASGIQAGDFSSLLNSESLTHLSDAARRVDAFGRFSLGNVRAWKRVRHEFLLFKLVRSVFEQFSSVLQDQRGIRVDLPPLIQADAYINAYPTDWESIIANLISNSVWALDTRLRNDRVLRVQFSLTGDGKESHLIIDDSGCGLEANTETTIFRAGFTTKRDAEGRDIGTGMGLTLVRAFVEDHSHGKISATAHGDLGGARFDIIVPTNLTSTTI